MANVIFNGTVDNLENNNNKTTKLSQSDVLYPTSGAVLDEFKKYPNRAEVEKYIQQDHADHSIKLNDVDTNTSGTDSYTITAVEQDINGYAKLTLDSTVGLSNGLPIRVKLNSERYTNTIIVDGNTVIVGIPYDELPEKEPYTPNTSNGEYADENNPYIVRYSDGTDTEKNSLFAIGKPTLGNGRYLGTFSAAFGSANIAAAIASYAAGNGNLALGGYSALFGLLNKGAYASLIGGRNNDGLLAEFGLLSGLNNKVKSRADGGVITGYNNILGGLYSAVLGGSENEVNALCSVILGGTSNKVTESFSIASGRGLLARGQSQAVFGQFNTPNGNDVLILGNGTSDSERSNALEVGKDGSIVSKGKVSGKSVVAPLFVGDHNETVFNSSTNEATNFCGIAGGQIAKCYAMLGVALGYSVQAGKKENKENRDWSFYANTIGCTAFGWGTQALHSLSFAAGLGNKTTANNQTLFGKYTKVAEHSQSTPHVLTDTDTLFAVGNGNSDVNRSNAFEVLHDGTVKSGKSTTESSDPKTLVTKDYLDNGFTENGTWTPYIYGSEILYYNAKYYKYGSRVKVIASIGFKYSANVRADIISGLPYAADGSITCGSGTLYSENGHIIDRNIAFLLSDNILYANTPNKEGLNKYLQEKYEAAEGEAHLVIEVDYEIK